MRLRVVFEALTGRLTTDMALARRRVQSETIAMQRSVTRTMNQMRGAFAFLGAGFGIGQSVRTMASFSQEMSTLRAVSGATEAEFASLNAEVRRLGESTRFTAGQAAQGATFLARAGFSAQEVLESLNDTLLLAQSGALDLGRAADIASNVLQGFRLETTQMSRVVDVLAATANKANTNVEQLGVAMSYAAPAAAAVGVEIEEASAAVGALSDAGVQAERAGTSLRQIMIQMIAPTGAAQAALRRMGLTQKDVDIQARGLIPVLETLAQRNVTLGDAADLVGTRQASALLILTESVGKMNELSTELRGLEGYAQGVADIMGDNLNGAMLEVASAAESVVLSFGELGAESRLTSFMNHLAAVLRAISADIERAAYWIGVLAVGFGVRLVGALRALRFALIQSGIGLVLVTLGEIAYQLDRLFASIRGATELDRAQAALEELLVRGVELERVLNNGTATGNWEKFQNDVQAAREEVERLRDELKPEALLVHLLELEGRLESIVSRAHESLADSPELQVYRDLLAETTAQADALAHSLGLTADQVAQLAATGDPGSILGENWDERKEQIEEIISALEDQREMLGKTARQATLYELSLLGANDAQIQHVNAIYDALEAYESHQDMLADAARVIDETRTAHERLNEELQRLRTLADLELIDQETYERAVAAAEEVWRSAQDFTDEWARHMNKTAEDVAASIAGVFEQWLFDPLEEGFKGLLRAFVDMLRRMAAAAASQAIQNAIMSAFKGYLGLPDVKAPAPGSGAAKFSGFATGTPYAPGGMAWVGERGPELVDLPRGSRVYPHHQSMRMASASEQLHITIDVDQSGNIIPLVEGVSGRVAVQTVRRAAPGIVKDSVVATRAYAREFGL